MHRIKFGTSELAEKRNSKCFSQLLFLNSIKEKVLPLISSLIIQTPVEPEP